MRASGADQGQGGSPRTRDKGHVVGTWSRQEAHQTLGTQAPPCQRCPQHHPRLREVWDQSPSGLLGHGATYPPSQSLGPHTLPGSGASAMRKQCVLRKLRDSRRTQAGGSSMERRCPNVHSGASITEQDEWAWGRGCDRTPCPRQYPCPGQYLHLCPRTACTTLPRTHTHLQAAPLAVHASQHI